MKLVDNNNNEIASISKFNLDSDDVLVFEFSNRDIPAETLSMIKRDLDNMFPNNKVLFICDGVELKILCGGSADEQRD